MTDIVERLRHIIPWCADINDLNAEAAAEIELLRTALQEIADMRYDNTSAATIARRALEPKP